VPAYMVSFWSIIWSLTPSLSNVVKLMVVNCAQHAKIWHINNT
jgi:hypothetical protein